MLLSVGDLFLGNRRRVSLCVYICVCVCMRSMEQSPNAEHICSGRPWHCHMAGKYASYSSSTKGRVRNEKRK